MKRLPEYLLVLFALVGTLSIAVSQAVMTAGAFVVLGDRGKRTVLVRPDTGLLWPVLGWAAASVLATLFSSDILASTINLKKLALLGMLFWAPAVVTRRWSIGRLVMALLFGAGITSLYGCFTFFFRQGGPALDVRIRGFHGFYLTNAGMLLLCSFPALLVSTQRRLAASHRLGAAIAAASILAVLYFGRIHSAWLGSVAGLGYLMIVRRRRIAAAVLALFALSFLVAPSVVREAGHDLVSPSSDANVDRLRMWGHGLRIFAQRPWTGWGLHDLRDVYAQVMGPGETAQGHLHSVPLTVAAQMGIPGLVALAWLVVGLFGALRRSRTGVVPGFELDVVDAVEAGLVAFLAAGLVDWNLGDSEILTLLCFLVGVAVAAGRVGHEPAAAA
ncbi:MAG: O-antigen ligase family protein [bacterium]